MFGYPNARVCESSYGVGGVRKLCHEHVRHPSRMIRSNALARPSATGFCRARTASCNTSHPAVSSDAGTPRPRISPFFAKNAPHSGEIVSGTLAHKGVGSCAVEASADGLPGSVASSVHATRSPAHNKTVDNVEGNVIDIDFILFVLSLARSIVTGYNE